MCYYNTDENTTPAPGTDHKLSTDTFEEWRKKRDAKEAAAGWSRRRIKSDAKLIAHKRKEIKDFK